jgi:antitoxin HicB
MPDYAVTLTRRYDGLFTATFADVPEAVAYGRDEEEALEEAAKSLAAALGQRCQRGEAPPPPRATGPVIIRPSGARAPTFV